MVVLCLGLLLPTLATAQSEPADIETPFLEEIEVHEVRLAVRVDNGLGLPVDDLTAADFSVFEDGKPVEIVDFRLLGNTGEIERVETGEVAEAPKETGQPESRPESIQPTAEDELVVLLFDLHENRPRTLASIENLLDWVDTHQEDIEERTWLLGVLDGSVGLVADPTSDAGTLRSALEELKKYKIRDRVWRFVDAPVEATWVQEARAFGAASTGRATPVGDEVSQRVLDNQFCLGRRHWMLSQIDSLRQLVESLAPVEGRKTIVWMHSSGLASSRDRCHDSDILRVTRAMQDLGSFAAAAGVVMHASSLGGLSLKYGAAAGQHQQVTEQNMAAFGVSPYYELGLSLGTLARNMAIHTGGQRVALNDPTWIFHRAFDDPVYEITVLVPHGRDGQEHTIDIDLEGYPLAILGYQRTYLDLSKRQLLMNQLERFSLLPGSYGAFPVHLGGTGTEDGDAVLAEVTVAVPAARIGLLERDDALVAELEPYVAVHTLAGELVEVRQLDTADLRLPRDTELGPSDAFTAKTSIRLEPGEYLFTGAFFDRLNETSGVTSAKLDLSR